MPRWRSLPEDLDPQIREFASQLRRLVDRSGLSVATIADRTGYSKSSWERYLNGRLLPPRGATQALAEVTGTDVRHLGTMWELAERAWSRSEMRHDTTLEAIRIAQARAALNEEPSQEREKGRRRRKNKSAPDSEAPEVPDASGAPGAPGTSGAPEGGALGSGTPGSGSGTPGSGGSTRVPQQGTSPQQEASARQGTPPQRITPEQGVPEDGDLGTAILRKDAIRAAGNSASARERRHQSDSTVWGTPAPGLGSPAASDHAADVHADIDAHGNPDAEAGTDRRTGQGAGHSAGQGGGSGGAVPHGVPAPSATPAPGGADGGPTTKGSGGRRKVTVLLASLVAVLVVAAGAVLFFDVGGGGEEKAADPKPSPTKETPQLPAGVKCSGKECSGKDPEAMGCGGEHAGTSSSAWVGTTFVEVRYSKVCKASWGRITSARAGDSLRITGPGGQAESGKVAKNETYTKMVSVGSQDEARACATLAAGGKGCTVPGKKAR
ncbi:helix-turn-helix domain-containing protein [Streptomyces smyrnaeus]|uniref:XRE family transcriptional regulator n=1 Tax=Streptomyces smyrnaeus TaxID=1387713 RepID=UPI003691E87A